MTTAKNSPRVALAFRSTFARVLLLSSVALLIGCSSGSESVEEASLDEPAGQEESAMSQIDFPEPQYLESNGIRMAVYEAGEGFPVVFSHGFPELAYSWRHQLPALAAAGFRAIAPDQRGYGLTDKPEDIAAYSLDQLCADLIGVLDALEIEKAVFVGHDWGGGVVWRMPLLYPDRVAGIVGVNTPFGRPPGPEPPIEMLRRLRGENNYVVSFQEPYQADEVLAADVDKAFRFFYRKGRLSAEDFAALPADAPERNFELLEALKEPVENRDWELIITEEELGFYVDTYERTGFTGGINWYRNIDQNWADSKDLDFHVEHPSLYIGAADDTVLPPSSANGMEEWVPNLEKQTIDDCGHWTQQERPDELNAILIDWLQRHVPSA